MWLIYFLLMASCIILPQCCAAMNAKPQQAITIFDRYSTQTIKGVAICLIVLCHYMGKFGGGITLFTPLGGIGVMIFLMLAAYGLNESWNKNGSSGWWRKRVIAVFFPYAIVQLGLYWAAREFSGVDLLLDIFLIKPRYVYGWYLNYLLTWYLIFYIVMKLPTLRKHKITVLVVVSVLMFFIFDEIRAEQSLSFLSGIALSDYMAENEKKKAVLVRYANWKSGVILVGIGILFLALKQLPVVRQSPVLIFRLVQLMIKFPCGLGICIIGTSLLRVLNMQFFYYVGAIAYEIYLIHGYVLSQMPVTIQGAIIFMSVSTGMAVCLRFIMSKTKRWQKRLLRV